MKSQNPAYLTILVLCCMMAVSSVSTLECYHCFYSQDTTVGDKLEDIFGKNMPACEKNPPECSLQSEAMHSVSADESPSPTSYLKTGQFSFAILDADTTKSTTGVQATYDHCVKVNGTIDGSKFVFRTGRYFGDDMDGECMDVETVVRGMRIVERDCYCGHNRNKCNGDGTINTDKDKACINKNGVNKSINANFIVSLTVAVMTALFCYRN